MGINGKRPAFGTSLKRPFKELQYLAPPLWLHFSAQGVAPWFEGVQMILKLSSAILGVI